MVNAGRGRRNGIFYRICGHQDHLTYCSQCGLPSAQSVSTSRPKTFVEIVGLKEPANFAVVATRAVMLLFLAGVMSIAAPAVGAEVAGVPEGHGSDLARPGEKCKVFPLYEWTQSEKWAWTEICEARIANFNERLGGGLFDPRDVKDVQDLFDRFLSSSFLETILLHEPFRSAIPRQGVHIIGAYFPNRIDLSDASIHRPLILEQSRFESNVELSRLTTSTILSFQGSRLKCKFIMEYATVKGSLFMHEGAEFDAVNLEAAKIGGDFDMSGSSFKGKLNMNVATIGSDLFMRKGAEFAAVDLVGAKIGGDLYMNDSTFKGELNMSSATVKGHLFMRKGAEFAAVDLVGAKIGNQLVMNGSVFEGELNMTSATVGSHLFMSEKAEFAAVDLVGAKIGGNINMSDSVFECKLDMDAATVGGDLLMGKGAEFDAVDLLKAKIGGQINMIGSTFDGKLNMNAATVGDDLLMREGAEFKDVILRGAKIGGQIGMSGSRFKGELDMDSISVGTSLLTNMKSEFNAIILTEAKIGGRINMIGSVFEGKLNMNSATVGSHLLMREGAEFDAIDLTGAKIGGNIDMSDSKFKGELNMASATVGGDLLMGAVIAGNQLIRAEFKDVNLRGAKIGGQIYMSDSKFKGKLNMASATVGGDLLMGAMDVGNQLIRAEFKEVNLRGAKIGNQLVMNGSRFKGKLEMDAAMVGGGLFMTKQAEFKDVDLTGAKIGNQLVMNGSVFEGEVIMDYAMIGSHLVIHGANFKNSDILSLRHTNVGTLQDDKNVWPDTLNLDGFTYKRLGGKDASDEAANRGRGSFEKWLAKNDLYSPQPYRHLASVLRAAGHNDMANGILVASRDREREESSPLEGKWWLLILLKIFIGYGYGNGNFWALLWAAVLVVVGTIVLHFTEERKKHDEFHKALDTFCYSLDMLLPIIRLREHHYKNVDLKTGARYYFYFHQIMGYVLIFFVIAGLSGLTS